MLLSPKKSRLAVLLAMLRIAGINGLWRYFSQPNQQQRRNYADLVCIASNRQPRANQLELRQIMQTLVEKNNNDYALRPNKFDQQGTDFAVNGTTYLCRKSNNSVLTLNGVSR